MSDNEKRFTLRMDASMFESIKWCAKKHKRSVAKEIEYAIDFYLDDLAMRGELIDENDDFYVKDESLIDKTPPKDGDIF